MPKTPHLDLMKITGMHTQFILRNSEYILPGYNIGDTFFVLTILKMKNYINEINLLHNVEVHYHAVTVKNLQEKPGPVMNHISVKA